MFVDDPADIIDEYERLQEPPPFALHSTWRVPRKGSYRGRSWATTSSLRSDLPAGYFVWATGAGKTTISCPLSCTTTHKFDLAMVVVKSHNKMDTQRKLESLGDIASIIIDGTIKKRYETYE